jgi:thioredoxin 1
MNSVRNYFNSIPSIDWKKEAKETVLPAAANLAVGTLINYNNPIAFAIFNIAKQSFFKPWRSCVIMADAALTKKMNQIFPSYEKDSLLPRTVATVALSIVIPFIVGYKVSQYAGYPISSPFALVMGTIAGGIAHVVVEQKLQKDPFKESDILTINKESFQKEVVESNLPVVVDAYATWCPPCKAMAPIFSEISKELSGQVKFVKFNIDDNKDLATQFNIQAVPTFLFFKEGKSIETHRGGLPKEAFMTLIKALFN